MRIEAAAGPRILLVNPWIYDFAAYDFWAQPMGLLYLAAVLRCQGYDVSWLDCLERRPSSAAALQRRQGRGPYLKTAVAPPAGLADVPRTYSRYGMSLEKFEHLLRSHPPPDVVLLTCLMTYWYAGVQTAVGILRRLFPRVPLILGGIYATLCRKHALNVMDVDQVVSGPAEALVGDIVQHYTGWKAGQNTPAACCHHPSRGQPARTASAIPHQVTDCDFQSHYWRGEKSFTPTLKSSEQFTSYGLMQYRSTRGPGAEHPEPPLHFPLIGDATESYPYPAWDLQPGLHYLPVLTSRGCPLACPYCASSFLTPRYTRRPPQAVLDEIEYWQARLKVRQLVFYDDALLLGAAHHAQPLLEGLINRHLQLAIHTPNALHIRAITPEMARLMRRAGFQTLRLGLESAEFDNQQRLDHKVTARQFRQAVQALQAAGFTKNQVGAYILVGLPEQTEAEIQTSFDIVHNAGVTPIPAYYSPIPHTPLWSKAVQSARYDLEADPVFTNNAVLPCRKEGFSWPLLTRLKPQT